ncbi:MAG: hypothetical protein LBM77_06440 [Spirochaetaceae bacterium]|jgi:hypothetical protein|nr:hypothetical protein [Spirochaetaceae bacterium]
MTLQGRNNIFRALTVFALVCILLVALATWTAIGAYPGIIKAAAERPDTLSVRFLGSLFPPEPYIQFIAILFSSVFAFISLLLINRSFEQTQSPEIVFIVFWTASLALESAQILLPLCIAKNLPGIFLVAAYRVQLFGRYFGLFSLFAASVAASGLEMQKYASAILIILVCALIVSLGTPIDSNAWNTSLDMINGYQSLLQFVNIVIIVITVITYLIAAYTRGQKEYVLIALGAALAWTGKNLLTNADIWVNLPLAAIGLSLGVWLMVSRLHKIYLWL